MYWLYRYILITKYRSSDHKAIKFLRFLRQLNIIFLLAIGMIIPFIKGSNKDLVIAIGVFLFGVIEHINYYWYRLSYGRSGFNIGILLSTGMEKSSINKLIGKTYRNT